MAWLSQIWGEFLSWSCAWTQWKTLKDDGWWLMEGCSFVQLFPSSSLSSSFSAADTARWGPSHKSLQVCEHSCRGDEEMSSSVHVCMCMRTFFFFSFPPLLSSLAFSHFTSLPSLASASHDRRFAGPLCAPLFLSLNGRRRQGQSQVTENRCGWTFAGEGWMLLCTQVSCLWGQGLTQSSRCVHIPPFTALWMSWTLLPSNISVPYFQEMPTVILCHTCFNVS